MAGIKEKHQLRFPAGEGKTSFIDLRDIANMAGEILLHPKDYINQAYTVTSGEALSYAEVAELFSKVLNIKIEYVNTINSKDPGDQRKIQHPFYKAVKRGEFAEVSKDCEQVLKRAPIVVEKYIMDYKNYFL